VAIVETIPPNLVLTSISTLPSTGLLIASNPGAGAAIVRVLAGGETIVTFTDAVAGAFELAYAANLNIGDSFINVTNAGTTGGYDVGDIFGRPAGGICVNAYFFDSNEELLSCCSCYVSPNGLHSFSLQKDFLSNLLTPGTVNAGTVVLVATNGATGMCANQAATWTVPEPGKRAWMSTLHQNSTQPSLYQATEFPFQDVALDVSEQDKLRQICGSILTNGSKHGVCNSCPSSGLGAANQ
jgi:hypothetical protein